MTNLDQNVKTEIAEFITGALPALKNDAEKYGCLDETDHIIYGMDLTIACCKDGKTWNFQTGDNSFTGSCYSLPCWAVTSIHADTEPSELIESVIEQLEDSLYYHNDC